MRCNACVFAGLLTVLFVASNTFMHGYALPCPAMGEPTHRVPPLTQKSGSDTPCFPTSDGLPSSNLVMHSQASEAVHQQPAVAPRDLDLQLLESAQAASPGEHRNPNRTRTRRPIAAPAPSPRIRGHHHPRQRAPAPAPGPLFAPVPPTIYAPPPNDTQDCKECDDGYTSAPAGAPCGCVIPMTAKLQLAISLEKLFPLVAELAKELADSLFLQPSQVRIMGANAVPQFQDKTDVTAQFVPLATAFDNTTAVLLASQIWDRRVKLNETHFGHYLVIYVKYPGLPPPPPSEAEPDSSLPPSSNGETAQRPIGVNLNNVSHKMSGAKIAVIALASTMGAVICLGVIWLVMLKCNSRVLSLEKTGTELVHASAPRRSTRSGAISVVSGSFQSASVSGESNMPLYTGTAKCFSMAELSRATENFKPENIVGQGGFGTVYQGKLDDGTYVAVKVLTRGDQQGGREFVAEVEMLSRLHHRNLVKLVGICTEEMRCLVYELIPNGSVESHLHGIDKFIAPLDWEARLKIALGAARGLAYLHEDSNPRVIHRDFKASNILLEMDFTPKVSDFGLAKAAAEGGHSQHISTRVMGTFGYVAPEYAMTGHLLVKSDVYSYGVVLLELLSGRMPVDMNNPEGQQNLVTWARPLLTTKEGLETLIDPDLQGENFSFDNYAKVAAIASMCVQPEVSHRPFMGEVVQALKLVYNDSDASESHPGDYSPDLTRFGTSSDPRMRFLPDSSFLSSDYDSGPLYNNRDPDVRPFSASAVLSDSGRSVWQLSASFRRQSNSGPLKTSTGHKPPAWYRIRGLKSVTKSDHGANGNGVHHGT
ncbi:hypothetical protein KC19_2G198000 [Ceratodon purpureus]|uniref:Protein kinase domain-containing protein n=1 Tax=Ceratodon purpureus TaxID=3225 RepID=A0A8T0IVX9_CERPU|nr:hypothetical protein KC19_2G198000 [Ceratodon purpureus]